MTKILVTGSTGFLGRHLMPILKETYEGDAIIGVSSSDANLTCPNETSDLVGTIKPDTIIHLAAFSGGIGANQERPADFFHINSLLLTNIFAAAAQCSVSRMIYTMGGCSYPADATSPIPEAALFKGIPQSESAAYSMAKAMGVIAARAYKTQHGLDTTVLIPGNLYGEYDNFRTKESHVIPAMIRRFIEARRSGNETIEMWGSGSPQRDFVYAGDVAAMIPYFLGKPEITGPINLSSGSAITIKCLAETIARITDFKGKISWNTSKPDGQMIKIFDVQQMQKEGLSCPTSLEEGLKQTVAWFDANYDLATDGLRL